MVTIASSRCVADAGLPCLGPKRRRGILVAIITPWNEFHQYTHRGAATSSSCGLDLANAISTVLHLPGALSHLAPRPIQLTADARPLRPPTGARRPQLLRIGRISRPTSSMIGGLPRPVSRCVVRVDFQ